MVGFSYQNGALVCDGLPIAALARSHGTPLYVYSAGTIDERYRALDAAFAGYPHVLHYALKANSTLGILRRLRRLGASADANSAGEIEVARRAGFAPAEIVFTGVGKTNEELELAVRLGVKTINAESVGELQRIDAIALARGVRARVAVRVNPDIDARSHPHISTGLRTNKFGVALDEAAELCRTMARRPGLAIVGLHVHVGSQITELGPLERAATALAALAEQVRADGVPIEHLDLGGGLGIPYDGRPAPGPEQYAAALMPIVRRTGLALILEPGRAIVGPAGALIATVVDVKGQPGDKIFVVLDAGMTELLRPALYGAYHRVVPVHQGSGPEVRCDIVGPVCESSDTLAADRMLPLPSSGDLLAVLDAGAYGSVMGSTYNRRPLPAEVLVADGRSELIRRRQTVEDMLKLEM